MRLILASQSPRRAEILRRVAPPGMVVEVIPADIDEKDPKYHRQGTPTLTSLGYLTLHIAANKTEEVSKHVGRGAIVVGADSIVLFGNEMREKPSSPQELRRYLESYSGLTATCVTTIVIRNTITDWGGAAIDHGTVQFGFFTPAEIDAMVRDPLFMASAGGFLTEHPLMRDRVQIVGDDDIETVLGLSGKLARLLIDDALAS